MEAKKPVTQSMDTVAPVSYLKDIIITLGVLAIIINLLMCLVYSVLVIIGKHKLVPKWMAAINFIFLIFNIELKNPANRYEQPVILLRAKIQTPSQ